MPLPWRSMNRLLILATAATAFGVGRFLANPPVDLQPTTPGTQQSGNINVSGTVLAGTFYGSSSGTTTKVVSGWATSPTGFVFGGDFRTNSVDGRGLFASALAKTGSTYGGDFRSASTTGRGIFGYATSTTGQAIGGDFRSDASSGTGIIGRVTSSTGQNVGGLFTSASSQGIALKAVSSSTTGATFAAVFDSSSNDNSVSTGLFRSNASSGNVVALTANITASNSTFAKAIAIDGRNGFGAYCAADGVEGYGIFAEGGARGVYGHSSSGRAMEATSDNPNQYGVYATAPVGGTGNALFANGTFAASGTKALKIDHPDDPENRYLQQFCTEGDTPQLQYRGEVHLDASGSATVILPSYFDKINRDPSYQLTAIGASMPGLYVAQRVTNNRFRIAGGKAHGDVSWTVIGIRNDRFMQKYGATAEMDKADENKGSYLMPELYNKPRQLREGYSPKEDALLDHGQPEASNVESRLLRDRRSKR